MATEHVHIETWRAEVERELRGRSLDILNTTLPGGLTIQPLYTDADRRTDGGVPGEVPYTRGSALWAPWHICPRHDDPRREALRSAIAADLDNGAEGIWLRFDRHVRGIGAPGEDGVTLYQDADYTHVFADRDLSALHARLDAGSAALQVTERWMTLAQSQGASLQQTHLRLCMDPLSALMGDGQLPHPMATLWSQAAALVQLCTDELPLSRALTVSTAAVHGAGSDAPLELGVAMASLVATLRGLEPYHTLEDIAAQVEMSLPMGRDIFLNIARMRAMRTLWSHVLSHCGLENIPAPDIHAFSGPITLSRRDPWTNMLRVTTQTFSAIVGGAQRVTAAAFDEALGQPEQLGRRLARNTPLILRSESHIGQVTDPVGGSYYVESLTAQLIAKGWQHFQHIESQGGLAACLEHGWLAEQLQASWASRHTAIAHGRWPVTGVSRFPELAAAPLTRFQRLTEAEQQQLNAPPRPHPTGPRCSPLPQHRDAAPFEALRDRADAASTPLVVYLATLGPRAAWTPRANFAANLLATAGISTIEDPGASGDSSADVAAQLAQRATAAGATAVCICGTNAAYDTHGVAVATALQDTGLVLLAGKHSDELHDAGVDLFVHLGCNALAALDTLLTHLGA